MNSAKTLGREHSMGAYLFFLVCLLALLGSSITASLVQKDFGGLEVTNVTYPNFNGIEVRAKLLRPHDASRGNRVPGIVYIHGYQNNRETGDAYCIELARRGFAVLNIDAIGRGNSGIPKDPGEPDFDKTFGGRTSLEYLRSLPFVRSEATGMMGHSLGAEMAYNIALDDPEVKALVITGFAYRIDSTWTTPKNMLMVIGKYDEYRKRMTGTMSIEKEWMTSMQTRKAIPAENPQLEVTYGDFIKGTARRVFVPRITHIQESHSREAIAETLDWMKKSLQPDDKYWIPPGRQIWQIKELFTFIAMIACFASLLPLGLILLRTGFFRPVMETVTGNYVCTSKSAFKLSVVNGLLMWLYLPLIFVLFGVHVYLFKIDKIFPLMMANGVIWWFLCINIIGFFLFRRWFKKESEKSGLTLMDMGVSYRKDGFSFDPEKISKTILLAIILSGFAYFCEHLLEQIFITDFRFIFPFASDLTKYRAFLCLIYYPVLLMGFMLLGIFIHGRLLTGERKTWLKTFIFRSDTNILALVIPLVIFLMVQYVPLFTTGYIPFVGPGGMFVSFVLNLFHLIIVLILTTPISTWFHQLTGKIYLGAMINAALVTWMFASSQVIAPIPV